MRAKLWAFLWPFFWGKIRARGDTRLELVQDWTADLASTLRWFARWGAWRPPTRRQHCGPQWPLPRPRYRRRYRQMAAEMRALVRRG